MPRQRRAFSPEFKLRVVQEVESGQSQAAVARRYELSPHLIPLWKKAFQTGRLGGEATGGTDVQRLLAENRQLKELLGKKELELDFLKESRPSNASGAAAVL